VLRFARLSCLVAVLAACGDPDCPSGTHYVEPRCVPLDAGAAADASTDAATDGAVPDDTGPDSDTGPGDASTCADTLCGTDCVDTMTDTRHCGECGNDCGADLRCLEGACTDVIVAVEAGDQHTCALRATGAALCWGDNRSGELGDGTTTDRHVPTAVIGVTDAVQIALGGYSFSASKAFTCVRRRGGAVSCWGNNESGTLGDGTTTARSTPGPVAGVTDSIHVTAGWGHACAVRGGGTVHCWGANDWGQLGDGTTSTAPVTTPTSVVGLTEATAVSAGNRHTCAIVGSGAIKCWGYGETGALGENRTMNRSSPVNVVGIDDAVQVLAGADSTCALRASGAVECWGSNHWGNLGRSDADTTAIQAQPQAIAAARRDFELLTGKFTRTCGLRVTGEVWCWGLESAATVSLPADHGHFTAPLDIAAGERFECAVTASGGVACVGANFFGQLGDGTTEPRDSPVMAVGLP